MKPIEPIEISIGARIQDPRSKIAQGSSLGILDLGSWILVPIEISIGSIGFNRDPSVESVWMCLDNLTVYACVQRSVGRILDPD